MANILIVEDNPDVAAIFAEILKDEGHKVETVAAAYGAIIKAIRVPFDLILMDLLLQGSNGAVTSLALRGLGGSYENVPIIVITGGMMPLEQDVYDRARFAGRMLKPVLPKELIAEVDKHLNKTMPEVEGRAEGGVEGDQNG
jgi:CheY-like chemotaxis protein